jgi:hypothetical protein
MKIQPINFYYSNNLNLNNNAHKKNLSAVQNNDSILFTGSFKSDLLSSILPDVKTENQAETMFFELFNRIREDSTIIKTPEFHVIDEVVQKKGFRGLLHGFWSTMDANLFKIARKAEQEELVLAKFDNKPIFQIYNLGNYGYFNSEFAQKDVKLFFSEGAKPSKINLEFGMDKDGNVTLFQSLRDVYTYTVFHRETGFRKMLTTQSGQGFQETTYYKKNGEKSFWKNFFQGGVAIPNY